MKLNYSIAALLLMVAGWQTAAAQGMEILEWLAERQR